MKQLRQELRRPVRLVLGILIFSITLTGMMLGVGQAYVAQTTQSELNSIFSTVALPVVGYGSDYSGPVAILKLGLPEEITAWIDSLPQEYPDLVKKITKPSLASAYIPQLNIDNCTRHPDYVELAATYFAQPQPTGSPYSCAVLEVTLTEVGEIVERTYSYQDGASYGKVSGNGIRVKLSGTVNRAIGLESGYNDPTGYRISMTLTLPSEEAYHALQISVGERYLVYGQDYFDKDWNLRSGIFRRGGIEYLQTFQDACLIYEENSTSEVWAQYIDGEHEYALSQKDMEKYHSITLSLIDQSAMPVFEVVTDENGKVTAVRTDNYTLLDENGQCVSVSAEEYRARYGVPTIVKLDGTAEAFLASEDAVLWNTMLHNIEINSHAFPVIGVEGLGYVAEFARENARIVEGRDFTMEELTSGAKVCILSESLAAANGIQVGDTLDCCFYNYDYSSPYQNFIFENQGTVNPSAYFYTSNTPFNGEEEGYMVIGLYRQKNEWANVKDNGYAFTPNTIFVPDASLTSSADHAETAMFKTLVLHNGAVEKFVDIVAAAGYDGLFAYYDQGYSEIVDGFLDYQAFAKESLIIGLAVYVVGLLAVLILFPMSLGRNMQLLCIVGATRPRRIGYAMLSGWVVLLPSAVLGFMGSRLLWGSVTERVIADTQIAFSLDIESSVLLRITAIQFVLATVMLFFAALMVSRKRKTMKVR